MRAVSSASASRRAGRLRRADTHHALVPCSAVDRALTRERALLELHVASMEPARAVVLAGQRERAGRRHRLRPSRSGSGSGCRRRRLRLRIGVRRRRVGALLLRRRVIAALRRRRIRRRRRSGRRGIVTATARRGADRERGGGHEHASGGEQHRRASHESLLLRAAREAAPRWSTVSRDARREALVKRPRIAGDAGVDDRVLRSNAEGREWRHAFVRVALVHVTSDAASACARSAGSRASSMGRQTMRRSRGRSHARPSSSRRRRRSRHVSAALAISRRRPAAPVGAARRPRRAAARGTSRARRGRPATRSPCRSRSTGRRR